jgi:predicted amidohydrolase YtcJ
MSRYLFQSATRIPSLACVVAVLLFGAHGLTLAQSAAKADAILYNGKIWTVDPAQPDAQAIAVAGDTILRVGSDTEVLALRGPRTRVFDLRGARVLPGFNDAHTHFENATQWFYEARLIDVRTEDEVKARIAQAAERIPAGMWITAYDAEALAAWSASKDSASSFHPLEPKLQDLDAASGNHPLLIRRYDGIVFINSKAIAIARLGDHAPDPLGGRYGRDPVTDHLTGALYGKAAEQLIDILPPATMASKLIAARGVLQKLNAVGITSIHDIARLDAISQLQTYNTDIERSYTDVNIFRDLERQGQLTVRVYAYQPLRSFSQLAAFGIQPGSGDRMLRFGILKEFVDGSWMLEPYANRPDYSGGVTFRFTSDEDERRMIREADRSGWDIGIHTIGDRALSTVLDWYCDAEKANDARPSRRDRIIHMWYANPDLIRKAGQMHLIADITPYQLLADTNKIDKLAGPERAKWAFAWRSMIDAGMRLNLVSDMPGLYNRTEVNPINPLENMYYAITRKNTNGEPAGGWHPEQSITLKEAIAAYTMNPAYASHEEDVKGSLKAGKLADLVVLSKDILSVPPEELLSTHVLLTLLGGKVVYNAPGSGW